MNSEQGDDVWGDEDFLNALIQATEHASAVALSSGGGEGGGASFLQSRAPSSDHPPGPVSVSSRNPVASATVAAVSSCSWYTPFERRQPSPLPPPPSVRVAPSAWQEWEGPFAAGNLAAFAFDGGVDNREYDFSPPRELSQREERTEPSSAAEQGRGVSSGGVKHVGRSRGGVGVVRLEKEKDKEIERLKRELERVLKKLDRVECEVNELQKDTSKKDKELECAFSEILARDAELESLKKEKLLPSKQDHSQASIQPSEARISVEQDIQFPITEKDICLPESYTKKRKTVQSDEPSAASELKGCIVNYNGLFTSNGCFIQRRLCNEGNIQLHHTKAIGIQTELENSHPSIEEGLFLCNISSKLLSVWGPPPGRLSGQHLITRLLVSCSTDLYMLFRFIGISSNINMDLLTVEKFSDVALHDAMCPAESTEAQKIFKLYSVMVKMRKQIAPLDDLLDILMELFPLGNVLIVHRSLRILNAVLKAICSRGSYKRDNIMITQSPDNMFEGERGIRAESMVIGLQEVENACDIGKNSVSLLSRSSSLQNPWNDKFRSSINSSSLSLSRRISLFETMHQLIVSNANINVQMEAISVMNLILLRSDPISERGMLGLVPSFTSVSHMLGKEIDPCAKRQAVKLLFLLLNCPKLLTIFCTRCNDDNEQAESADGKDEASSLRESISSTLRGLAECMAHRGNSTQELILCKETIILLAFIASSGKSGFEILLYSATARGCFLEMMVEVLASLMDIEGGLGESQDLHKERTALIREALILLNRVASNAVYSKSTLGVLTQGTTMAALTVDVVNRICQKMSSYCKQDSTKKVQMEAEIVDLARLLRTRILSFLGGNSS